MSGMEPKKLSLIRILQILQQETDADHPMTHAEIVNKLERDYGIAVERKMIGRSISLLNEAGYEIETTQKGCYLLVRTFEDSELRLLIDSVLSSQHIAPKHSQDLIERLCALSNKHFRRHVKNVYSVNDWNKTENGAIFYNIDIIDEAIDKKRQITFSYNKYGVDKKLHRTAEHTVSPYQLVLHNQRYYLMALHEKWGNMTYFRLDRITNIAIEDASQTPLRSVKGYESGIDYKRFSSALPYMFSDLPVYVEFWAEKWVIDQVVDWFGKNISMVEKDGRVLVGITVSPNAMEYWAMQYLNAVEIISPQSLRDKIKGNLKTATEKYNQ